MIKPEVRSFFHEDSNTVGHLVHAPGDKRCAIIDAALDYDQAAGRTRTDFADLIVGYARQHGLTVEWILETHAHADHLSAAPYLKQQLGGKIGIGEHITDVQKLFKALFNVEKTFNTDGSQFDRLFKEGDRFEIGALEAHVIHTPGHTPACITYVIGDAAFVGDTLFMPDGGTARADFPGGDAATLYRSIEKILALPPETRLFICHDYGPGGRAIAWETTVAEQRAKNIHVHQGVSEPEFVRMRTERDKQLAVPTLLMPSIQVNMRAGKLPPPEDNGVSYIKIPINRL
jgi:glyoxylase-like metal-dependent hydrolase (beta-lactamase superfamily II)